MADQSGNFTHSWCTERLLCGWLTLAALGMAARAQQRWAFLAGIVLYAADMIPLIMMFSLWAFGVHAFFVFRWFQGQKALQELTQPTSAAH